MLSSRSTIEPRLTSCRGETPPSSKRTQARSEIGREATLKMSAESSRKPPGRDTALVASVKRLSRKVRQTLKNPRSNVLKPEE